MMPLWWEWTLEMWYQVSGATEWFPQIIVLDLGGKARHVSLWNDQGA